MFNTITAIVGLDINSLQINGANDTLFRPAMKEISAIAASEGVESAADAVTLQSLPVEALD